jgi:hypothetical protein
MTGGVTNYFVSLLVGCLLDVVADLARHGVHSRAHLLPGDAENKIPTAGLS